MERVLEDRKGVVVNIEIEDGTEMYHVSVETEDGLKHRGTVYVILNHGDRMFAVYTETIDGLMFKNLDAAVDFLERPY